MLRCIREHVAPGFGTIPVGSLWENDSPYVGDESAFEDADKPKKPTAKKSAARKGER